MSTIFQKYAAALLPFFVLVVGASQTVFPKAGDPVDWNAVAQFVVLVLGAVVTYLVPLLGAKWQGAAKTGVAIVAAVISALLPFILPGGFDPSVSVPVIIVAVLNVISTELGVQIRTSDTAIDGGIVPDAASTSGKHVAEPADV
jgi:hypothetical protein